MKHPNVQKNRNKKCHEAIFTATEQQQQYE